MDDSGAQQGTMVAGVVNKKIGAAHQQAREAWNTRKGGSMGGKSRGGQEETEG